MKINTFAKLDKRKNRFFLLIIAVVLLTPILTGCSSSCEPVVLGFDFKFNQTGGSVVEYDKSKVVYKMSVWKKKDPSSWVDERDIRIWVYKGSRDKGKLLLEITQQYANCDYGDSYVYLDPKKVNIFIDGKRHVFDQKKILYRISHLNTDILDVRIKFPYEDKDKTNFKIEVDYRGKFKTVRNVEVNWLTAEEFEELKVEREKAEEGSGDEEEEVIDETG
ncbi:hypothetical protein HQ544_02080 [Candidatus Falkowbacteria bacterium]|nr:hypothetical protein [Candidatus Falkowbacteria bacterium]